MKAIKILALFILCLAASFGAGYLKALNKADSLRNDLRIELVARGLAGYNRTTGGFELNDYRPEPLPVSDSLTPNVLPEVVAAKPVTKKLRK